MAVLQMQRISICALKKNRKAILEELQSLGVMEVDAVQELDPELKTMETMNARMIFEKNAVMCDQAIEILEEFSGEKKSMLSSFAGKPLVNQKLEEDARDHQEIVMKTATTLMNLRKQLTEDGAAIVKAEQKQEALKPWLPLDIPMNFAGTEKVAVMIGSIDGNVTLDQVYARIAEDAPELEAFEMQEISSGDGRICLAVSCLREEAEALEEALRMQGFARPSQLIRRTPSEELEASRKEVEDLRKEMDETREKIRSLNGEKKNLQLVSDYFRIRAQKYEVLGHLQQSESTFFVTGYLPKKQVASVEQRLTQKYDMVMEAEEADGDDIPVYLQNSKFGSTGEGVLSAFGLPGKGEIDPSTIMTVCYVFLFGLMLSDAAYGLIVFGACFALLMKFPRMESGMQKSIRLFMYCGLSTMFWGIMFGGYFGDVVDVVSRTFFGKEISIQPVWFAPLNEPMKLLIYSMLFGLIHMFLGLGIKGYMELRDKKYLDFFCDVVLWFMFLMGLILIFLPSSMFQSIAQMELHIPAIVVQIGKWMAILGAVGIFLMSGRENKNPAVRLALGAYDLYNITGWLSDVLSYSRLLALGLATGVIAQVINKMGSMGGKSIPGVILFIVAFIIGHTFNLAINLLGAYVHTNRLQYVEFFGKFYEGGGREFHPFKEDTKYVDIKEEN